MTNQVGGALTRQLVDGDKPKVIETGGMDIEVSKVSDNVEEEDVGFNLSKPLAFFKVSDSI